MTMTRRGFLEASAAFAATPVLYGTAFAAPLPREADIVVIGAGALICVTAFAFGGTADFGHFLNAGTVATQLGQQLGSAAGTIFAIVLLNASLIGAAAASVVRSSRGLARRSATSRRT